MEQGGLTIIQDPNTAEYDGMPLAAVQTRMVDFVLPVAQMPQKLMKRQPEAGIAAFNLASDASGARRPAPPQP